MVKVRLFAILREKAGFSELDVQIPDPATVEDVLAKIKEASPVLQGMLSTVPARVAVNHEFANMSDPVRDGDEVALIPPVSGGTSDASQDRLDRLVRIQREDFSVDEAIAEVKKTSTAIGGITVFLGTARDISKGKDIDSLEFEHYPGMAEAKLREIRTRALDDFDIHEIMILHRYGKIEIGENIVLIVAASTHRDQAFRACRFCIDELKQITPIWKKEMTPTGESWVEEHP